MFGLIKIEFYKLWKRRSFLILLCSLCLINVGILAFFQNTDSTIRPTYQRFQNIMQQLPNHERFTYIEDYYQKINAFELLQQVDNLKKNSQENADMIESLFSKNPQIKDYQDDYRNNKGYLFTNNLESEVLFVDKIYKEIKTLHDYPDYIQEILDKTKTISSISIFQKTNDFTQKNLLKSANDYEQCLSVPITYESEKGIHEALSFPVSHFVVVISMIGIAIFIIMEEKEKNLFVLIQSTKKGQTQVIIVKCLVMCLSIGLFMMLITFSQLVYMSWYCGLGDLSRSLQSLASYSQCPLLLQVWQYLLIYMVVRWLLLSFIGLFILLLFLKCKNRIICFFTLFGFFIFELICYLFISPLSSLYLFKYINCIYIIQTDQLFKMYKNVNFFSHPVSLQLLIFVICLSICLILLILIIKVYHRKGLLIKPFQFPYHFKKNYFCLSLWKQELYKIFWLQKAIFVLIACLCLQVYQYSHIRIYQPQDQLVYSQYMSVLKGPLTTQKEEYLVNELQNFIDLNEQLQQIEAKFKNGLLTKNEANHAKEPIESLLQNEATFKEIYQQYERIQENPQLQFVDAKGYEELFLSSSWVLTPSILLIICLILSLSQVYSYDYHHQMDQVIYPSPQGYLSLKRKKLIISIVISIIFFFIVYTPPFILLWQTYDFSTFTAPIQSLASFQNFPFFLPLWSCILILYLMRLLTIIGIICILHFIEMKSRNYIIGILFISIFIITPLILIYGGYSFFKPISIYPFLMINQFLLAENQFIQCLILFFLYGTIILFSLKGLLMKPRKNLS